MIIQRVFRTRSFNRSLRRSALTAEALCRAVDEMRRGLVDADLGGGIFKKRVRLPGRGKRGSVRTIIAAPVGTSWFFLFGYEKNERATISATEQDALQLYASEFLGMSSTQLDHAVKCGDLQEICHDKDL